MRKLVGCLLRRIHKNKLIVIKFSDFTPGILRGYYVRGPNDGEHVRYLHLGKNKYLMTKK